MNILEILFRPQSFHPIIVLSNPLISVLQNAFALAQETMKMIANTTNYICRYLFQYDKFNIYCITI